MKEKQSHHNLSNNNFWEQDTRYPNRCLNNYMPRALNECKDSDISQNKKKISVKNQKLLKIEILDLKKLMTEMKTAQVLNKRFKLTKEKINRLENRSIDTIQFEKQNGKRTKKVNRTTEILGHHQVYQHKHNGSFKAEKREKRVKRIFGKKWPKT